MRIFKGALALGALFGVVGAANAVPEVKREHTFGPEGHIHGYVINVAGRGLPALVALRTATGKLISYHHTDPHRRGRFDIDNVIPGRYRISVESLGTNIEDLDKPEDIQVEVIAKKVVRPRLVAE